MSPLHSLVNIDSNALEPVLQGMLASAKLDLNKLCQSPILYAANQRIHSAYGEIFCRGTPLNWAVCCNRSDLVKLLLRKGAHALASDQNIAPLNLAAHLHNPECFTVLLEHEINMGPYIQFSFASLLEAVVVNADLYSRVVRHGVQHEEMFEKTLAILADRTASGAFLLGIADDTTTGSCSCRHGKVGPTLATSWGKSQLCGQTNVFAGRGPMERIALLHRCRKRLRIKPYSYPASSGASRLYQ